MYKSSLAGNTLSDIYIKMTAESGNPIEHSYLYKKVAVNDTEYSYEPKTLKNVTGSYNHFMQRVCTFLISLAHISLLFTI